LAYSIKPVENNGHRNIWKGMSLPDIYFYVSMITDLKSVRIKILLPYPKKSPRSQYLQKKFKKRVINIFKKVE
jgi:hypothetical protein